LTTASHIWTLAKQGFLSLSVQLVNRVLMLALGIVLARGLGVGAYGIYAFALAVLAALATFADLGIPQLTVREVARRRPLGEQQTLGVFLMTGRRLTLLVSALLLAIGFSVLQALSGGLLRNALLAMLFMLPGTLLIRFACAALRGAGYTTTGQAIEYVLVPAMAMVAIVLLFLIDVGYRTPAHAIAVQAAVALIVAAGLVPLFRQLLPQNAERPSPSVSSSLELLQHSLPFAFIGAIGLLNTQIDIIMLGLLSESDDVGLYRVAVLASMLVTFGLQAANAVLPTYFSRLQKAEDRPALQDVMTVSARAILALAAPVALVLIFWGGTLAAFVFGDEFMSAHTAIVILAIGELIGASMGSMGFLLYMTGREKPALRVLSTTAALNVAMNVVLIPLLGIVGAALATATSSLIRIILLYRLVRRELDLDPSPWRAMSASGS